MNYFKTIRRRCDTAMRSKKELAYTPEHRRWRCPKDFTNCICALETRYDGTEEHFNPMFKGVREDDTEET